MPVIYAPSSAMKFFDEFEYRYDPSVEEDDKFVGKMLTRRQALTLTGLAGMASLVGCGGSGGGSHSTGTSTSGSAPTITTQPSNVTAVVGSSATFTVVATGSDFTYQWYKGTVAITGATSATYTIGSVTSELNATTYHVVVTNSSGSVTSTNATLTTSSSATAPTITTQPTNLGVNLGATASFMVVASGTNLSYQWFKGGSAISGATNASYAISPVATTDEGSYSVVVTNTVGTVTSNTVSLTVVEVAPTITGQPSGASISSGGSATFTVTASGSNPTYQWYKGGTAGATANSGTGGTAISGATSASYSISSATTSSAGNYYVKVSNSAGAAYSTVVSLTVGSGIDLVVTPQAIEGPFWVDENINRSNLISPGSSRSTVAGGFPLTLTFTLYDFDTATSTGVPKSGAHIDIWHADTIGTYSDEASGSIQSENTTGQTWLRGYQVTDSNGQVTFQTIHPGWYTGRTPHIHVRIRTYDSSNNVTYNVTTQMFFTDTQNATVLAKSIYAHGTRTVFNSNDNVYSVLQSDGTTVGSHLLLNLTQGSSSETGSFTLAFAIP